MKKLFFVESDQITRIAFEKALEKSSWEVYSLNDMADFDFRFRDFTPDLLLLSTQFVHDLEKPNLSSIVGDTPWGILDYVDSGREKGGELFTMIKPIEVMKIELLLDELYQKFCQSTH